MPSALHPVKTYLTDEERAHLDALAARTHLSRSEILRRFVVGHRLPDPVTTGGWSQVRDLMAVNADLARLGNLLKLVLDQAPEAEIPALVSDLATQIAATQAEVKALAVDMRHALQPRRKV